MARKLRIQFPGAFYHVINQGNYRRDAFATVGAAQAFGAALAEACSRHGWRIHAYVIMRNHYHLALETPQANLVEGMHWLQGTFASRLRRRVAAPYRWIANALKIDCPASVRSQVHRCSLRVSP